VFFFTRQSLVSQDQDSNVDIYDAHVEGGISAQNQSSPVPCKHEETCLSTPGSSPVLGAPSSATFSGTENLTPPGLGPPSPPLTRAQKLAKALKACRRKPRKKRVACRRAARKRYASEPRTTRTKSFAHARKTVMEGHS
jgi:hypothetical protein